MNRAQFLYSPERSRGVALLTVLLVVAVATIAAVAMASRQQVDIRKTENLLRADQAWSYAQGIDLWAVGRLRADRESNDTDSLKDGWNAPVPSTLVEGGEVSAGIEDLQGRFNLNNLVNSGSPSPLDVARFRRLLKALDLNPDLADAVLDWIDRDGETRFPGGAEDDVYSQETPPYRAAGAYFAHPRELLLVKGFDETVYGVLSPYITALPEYAPINLNTAGVPVLMSLTEGISRGDAEVLRTLGAEKPFASLDDALAHQALAGLELDPAGLGVASDYFQVDGNVRVGRIQLRYVSIIHRRMDGTIRVIQRNQKGLFDE